MEKKDVENIGEFFSKESGTLTPEKKWEEIFSGWLDKIDQERMMLNLFELKLWFESIEEFHASPYLENLAFKHHAPGERNYEFYVFGLHQAAARIVSGRFHQGMSSLITTRVCVSTALNSPGCLAFQPIVTVESSSRGICR